MRFRFLAVPLLLTLPLVAACRDSDTPAGPILGTSDGLLVRYVAMGNSITAGFQSAGINDSTQRQSYAAVFASRAGAVYNYPSLQMPGCPPPFVSNVLQTRVGGGTPTTCALRAVPAVPDPVLNNVAVPGAEVIDGLSNADPTSNPNALTTFILGGRTQVQAMQQARPTFVSVWLGNNDVLGSLTSSANPGDPALVTSEAAFEANYTGILDSIQATGAKAALFGVAEVTAIPYASYGSVYWCLKNGCPPSLPSNPQFALNPLFTVDNSCAPAITGIPGAVGDTTLIPWTIGVVRFLRTAQGQPGNVNCSSDADAVTPAELAGLHAAVAAHNAFIQQQATTRGWAYVDVNPALLAARADPTRVAPFPDLSQAQSRGLVLFGSYFTLDGVHPSAAAHRVIADSLISAVNRTYGTTIPFAGP